MADIRPNQLPAAASVNPASAIIVDAGGPVEKATPIQVVDAAIPLASQADAEAGTDNEKRMTPLRVKQAIDELGFSATELASETGSSMVGFKQPDGDAILRDAMEKLEETVSAKDFGATGLGSSDDTAAVILANLFSLTIVFPAGGTYNLQNWVPRAGTRIIATGATINRYDDTTYSTTDSSAAVVVTNDDIEIVGGTWGLSGGATKALSFSGSILVQGGSAIIRDALIQNSWGGVFGHETQNGSNVCSYLKIEDCEFYNNTHNTYLADIENFSFINNHSHGSDRDGLRTFRNMSNLVIMGNHLYDNGNGSANQSQDGMDLFYGGKRCIIVGNYIYGNDVKGIDIKRGLAATGETVYGEKFIIQGNHIFDNGWSGIEFAQSQVVPAYNENIQILGNQITGNGERGIIADYCKNLTIADNIIHGNSLEGIRLSNVITGHVRGNIVYDNTGVGIFILGTCSDMEVTGNSSYDTGVATQTSGINISCSGRCHGNTVYGNTITQINSSVTDGSLKGEVMRARLSSGVSGVQYIGSVGRVGVVTGAKLSSSAGTTVDFLIAKRNANTGAFVGSLYVNDTESITGNLPTQLTSGSWNTTYTRVSGNELLYAVINSASSAFAMGMIELEVIT